MAKVKQMREFSLGESIRVNEKNLGPSDRRRLPPFIRGKVGKVFKLIGFVSVPPDHPRRGPYHTCIFDLNQFSPRATSNDKFVCEMYEDLMIHEPLSSVSYGGLRNEFK